MESSRLRIDTEETRLERYTIERDFSDGEKENLNHIVWFLSEEIQLSFDKSKRNVYLCEDFTKIGV